MKTKKAYIVTLTCSLIAKDDFDARVLTNEAIFRMNKASGGRLDIESATVEDVHGREVHEIEYA